METEQVKTGPTALDISNGLKECYETIWSVKGMMEEFK